MEGKKFGKYCVDCYWEHIDEWAWEYYKESLYEQGFFKCEMCGKETEYGFHIYEKKYDEMHG